MPHPRSVLASYIALPSTHFWFDLRLTPVYGRIASMVRYILFVFVIGLGIVIGNYYAEEINPVEVVDAPPDTLRVDYKTDYVLMVAEVYAMDQDPAQAARQLAVLSSVQPIDTVNQAIVFALENGYAPADLVLLQKLSEVMSTWNPSLELVPTEEN